MTQAHARAIMLMVVSSFCSHQCSEPSICLTKRLAWLWKRFCPSATLVISKEYWGWSWAPVVTIRCLICLPEWEITPSLDTKQGIGGMGHYPGWNAAGSWCSGDVYICASPHGHICQGGPEKSHKSCKCGSMTKWEVLSTPTTSTTVW